MRSINKYLNTLEESWVMSDDDHYYNFGSWLNNKNQVLLIIGLSGSGKTTLGKHLAKKYNCGYSTTDDIWIPILRKYKEKTGKKTPDMTEDEFEKIDRIVVKELEKILRNKNKKMIIEGIHIMLLKYPFLKEQSLVIKGTSYFKSFYQALKRDSSKYLKKGSSRFLDHYLHYLKMSKNHQISLHKLQKYLNKK
ncbi:AAA family ATPase [archaeon]|jgi:shikimate kinase|nr:AAA family ATPase [archaeon]